MTAIIGQETSPGIFEVLGFRWGEPTDKRLLKIGATSTVKTALERAPREPQVYDTNAEPPVFRASLEAAKARAYQVVDAAARSRIAAGFTHAGLTFSLSLAAQTNWTGLYSRVKAGHAGQLPRAVATIDDGAEYLVKDAADLEAIVEAIEAVIAAAQDLGNSAKRDIRAAKSVSEVDLILASL